MVLVQIKELQQKARTERGFYHFLLSPILFQNSYAQIHFIIEIKLTIFVALQNWG